MDSIFYILDSENLKADIKANPSSYGITGFFSTYTSVASWVNQSGTSTYTITADGTYLAYVDFYYGTEESCVTSITYSGDQNDIMVFPTNTHDEIKVAMINGKKGKTISIAATLKSGGSAVFKQIVLLE